MGSPALDRKEAAPNLMSPDRFNQEADIPVSRSACSSPGSLAITITDDARMEKDKPASPTPIARRRATAALRACPQYLADCFRVLFLSSWYSILLAFVPLAILARTLNWGYSTTFAFALIGLCAAAERLSFSTDQLAIYTNPTIGGLLNATMGNIGELMVSLQALQKGLLRVMQLALLGSLLSNLLLAVGLAFLAGGMRFHQQSFARDGVNAGLGLLMVGMLALVIPDALQATGTQLGEGELDVTVLSRMFSFIFLAVYGAFLYFQLVSHPELYMPEPDEKNPGAPAEEKPGQQEGQSQSVLGFWGAIVCVLKFTLVMAFLSDILIDCIEPAATELSLPLAFISAILLPMVGNASEISASVIFALKNQLDTSLSIAVGSSIQIAFFVVPILVLSGWWMDIPFTLNFHVFETIVLFASVATLGLLIQDGHAHWMKGVTLLLAYVLISGAYFHKRD
mmetsp:Transcript_25310/g.70778  ORF Transcript_25310/g.70778 Transcript_25310/m.70778 type:complete len:454 (-) Transcript_25310:226-1587(-)